MLDPWPCRSSGLRTAPSSRSTSSRTRRRSPARTTRPTRCSPSCARARRQQGLWAPHLPPEAGGTGGGFLAYAHLNEEIGRVTWAQYVFNCQAPDAGNGEILHQFGTAEQKERWLAPLVAGEARSFFSMTEPDVSGADPTGLQTTAVLDGDEWVIDGHKWFSLGRRGRARSGSSWRSPSPTRSRTGA